MVNKDCYIGICGKPKEEDFDICAKKVYASFELLIRIDNSFKDWYRTGKPQKRDALKPIEINERSIKSLLLEGQHYNDRGELIKDLGYHIYVQSETVYKVGHILSITCGLYNKNLTNNVVLTIGKSEDYVHLHKEIILKEIYQRLINIWHPDKGRINCNSKDYINESFL